MNKIDENISWKNLISQNNGEIQILSLANNLSWKLWGIITSRLVVAIGAIVIVGWQKC
ncbi:MAG TPA: hypothetical protein IGS52_18940 [Oscillatoriaceae cyanobacterium M33_DOE_052]|nr:hypothetical protein [Oscillatoriaceae cyanobacterium M33_DOE_052]